MTAPNRNTLWAGIVADELAKSGLKRVVIAPGSRSTPLTVAFARDERIRTRTHLDERSAAFFALGEGKETGTPTAVLTTSGTAAANLHPAVLEAHHSRTPLLLLTADRPPELQDSGANQTIDQDGLYGSAVRSSHTLPEPEPESRKLRSLRTTLSRAVAKTTATPPGPVHLNVPFRKPLEPVNMPRDVPSDLERTAPLGVEGRSGPFVTIEQSETRPSDKTTSELSAAIEGASRGLLVAGPQNPDSRTGQALVDLAEATGFPLLADPLSGLRFGPHVDDVQILGGYDGYLDAEHVESWPDADLVIRFGASPTGNTLQQYLSNHAERQILVDPAGEWREATFTATDRVDASPAAVAEAVAASVSAEPSPAWTRRFESAESIHWETVREVIESGNGISAGEEWRIDHFEGGILHRITRLLPDRATIFVSNSMPVRDLDRFARPSAKTLTVHGNRGVSGIDGITSTALGIGAVTDDPLVLVTGDLAFLHDTNGLLALDRFDLEATIVLVNNDGGGIFHMLPIEEFEPPFTSHFKTPHGLDFEATESIYGLEFERVSGLKSFASAFEASVRADGTQVIEVQTDAETSHRIREAIASRVAACLSESE
jgi:2-succinyl-5-enolpyruvyl-6-hydroxy-3-cyclohexene-1-carboxylate synthase